MLAGSASPGEPSGNPDDVDYGEISGAVEAQKQTLLSVFRAYAEAQRNCYLSIAGNLHLLVPTHDEARFLDLFKGMKPRDIKEASIDWKNSKITSGFSDEQEVLSINADVHVDHFLETKRWWIVNSVTELFRLMEECSYIEGQEGLLVEKMLHRMEMENRAELMAILLPDLLDETVEHPDAAEAARTYLIHAEPNLIFLTEAFGHAGYKQLIADIERKDAQSMVENCTGRSPLDFRTLGELMAFIQMQNSAEPEDLFINYLESLPLDTPYAIVQNVVVPLSESPMTSLAEAAERTLIKMEYVYQSADGSWKK